jgi:hypothetical protein
MVSGRRIEPRYERCGANARPGASRPRGDRLGGTPFLSVAKRPAAVLDLKRSRLGAPRNWPRVIRRGNETKTACQRRLKTARPIAGKRTARSMKDALGMGRADLTNEQWVRLVPLLPTGKKLHASFAKLSLGPCRGGMSLLLARWLAQNRHCCHCRSGSGSRRCLTGPFSDLWLCCQCQHSRRNPNLQNR